MQRRLGQTQCQFVADSKAWYYQGVRVHLDFQVLLINNKNTHNTFHSRLPLKTQPGLLSPFSCARGKEAAFLESQLQSVLHRHSLEAGESDLVLLMFACCLEPECDVRLSSHPPAPSFLSELPPAFPLVPSPTGEQRWLKR